MVHLCLYRQLVSFFVLCDFNMLLIGLSFQAFQSEKHFGQYYTVPSAHIHSLFPHGLPRRYQRQVSTLVMRADTAFKTVDMDFHIRFISVNKNSCH